MQDYIKKIILYCLLIGLSTNVFAKITFKNNFLGISGNLLENIKTNLEIKKSQIDHLNPQSIQQFFNDAPDIIKKTLQSFGYFTAQISSNLTHNKDDWAASFVINPGPPLLITKLNLTITGTGISNTNFQTEIRSFPLKARTILQTNQYNAAKQFLFEVATKYGYLAATFEKKVIYIDLKKYRATVNLVFNTGSRYFFGPITFSENTFDKNFLKRFLTFKEGAIYNSVKVRETQENFVNSNFFEVVTITPTISNQQDDYLVPLTIDLVPRKAKQYNFGLGYGTDTGPRGLIGLDMRHITADGQSFKGLIKISQIQKNIEAHYLIPGRNPINNQYDISAAGQMQNFSYGKSNTLQLAYGYITVLNSWQQTLKLSLLHENYQYVNQPVLNSYVLLPSINWLHSKTDNLTHPASGYNININIQGSSKHLLTNTDFLQSQINAKALMSITKNIRLVLRGTLGYTAVHDLKLIPLSLQFYTGGDQSIRGYGYNDIGPGKILNIGSIELRHKIIDDLYATAFYDVGNANNKFLSNLQKGAGIGVIYQTTVGAIALSYAKALNIYNHPGRIQFSLGPEF
jgi:translocation and assembly module TamA